MKRARFTEEQIIGILKENEAGAPAADLCRKPGMSAATLYSWKAKYGGLEVPEAKRLKALEDENMKLKRLLADTILDNSALKDLLSENGRTCRQAKIRCSSADGVRDERAAGLSCHRCRSFVAPLPFAAAGPCRFAHPSPRVRV